MEMLIGQDISHHNTNVDVNAGDFTVIKATEGQTYVDPQLDNYVKQLKEEQLVGFYHFIRADIKSNDAWIEADNFVKTVIGTHYMYKSLLVVDYEAKSVGHEDYLLRFLEGVKIMTGLNPVVYCSCSVAVHSCSTEITSYGKSMCLWPEKYLYGAVFYLAWLLPAGFLW